MNALEKCVSKLPPADCVCYVTFDELSLHPSLQYSMKGDFIRGFHDTGARRKPQFADHATVFMVRGVRKAWKYPVAYYFTDGSTFRKIIFSPSFSSCVI